MLFSTDLTGLTEDEIKLGVRYTPTRLHKLRFPFDEKGNLLQDWPSSANSTASPSPDSSPVLQSEKLPESDVPPNDTDSIGCIAPLERVRPGQWARSKSLDPYEYTEDLQEAFDHLSVSEDDPSLGHAVIRKLVDLALPVCFGLLQALQLSGPEGDHLQDLKECVSRLTVMQDGRSNQDSSTSLGPLFASNEVYEQGIGLGVALSVAITSFKVLVYWRDAFKRNKDLAQSAKIAKNIYESASTMNELLSASYPLEDAEVSEAREIGAKSN